MPTNRRGELVISWAASRRMHVRELFRRKPGPSRQMPLESGRLGGMLEKDHPCCVVRPQGGENVGTPSGEARD